jgi:DNA polymerase-3 subunit alpha
MELTADVASIEGLQELQIELDLAREGHARGNGEVVVRLMLAEGGEVTVRLGRGFVVSGALAERLAAVPGLANVALAPLRGRVKLRLVA